VAIADLTESARRAYENLNERERVLVTALGGILALLVVGVPFYLLTTSISNLEDENQEVRVVLRELGQARGRLEGREAAREAATRRYRTPAPPLGSFLEAKAGLQELTLREVTDQPEKVIGDFRRRELRATLPNVGLRPVIRMLTEIENSPFPVAVNRLQFEHFRAGDRYNVKVGLIAYQSEDASDDEAQDPTRSRDAHRAGPPSP
jgi:hypothetical protein